LPAHRIPPEIGDDLDYEKLTYRYSGRDYRLTDLAGVVAKDVVA
jgi:hypothetical protein